MWNNLLPQGSRTVELYSSIGILAVAILMFLGVISTPIHLTNLDSRYSWNICLGVLGFLQFYSIWLYPKLELLRVITAWLAGCFWMWAGLDHGGVDDIASIVLGMANFYGVIINFNLLHRSWQNSPS